MNRCNCGNLRSELCIEKKCGCCCFDKNCERHTIRTKSGIEVVIDYEMEEDCYPFEVVDVYNGWDDNVKKICNEICCVAGISKDVCLNIIGEYICVFWICAVCGNSAEDEECWQCESCGKIFGYMCQYPNSYTTKCKIKDCYYCDRGYCLNGSNSEGDYCNECYVDDENEDDSFY
ncbi:MAG: hypothetical protein Hyperionvirus16_31 [Hyperionvirus sp.]|uniref:Uncharacterized protein n=1 Tax=Hyperionvirus sp. TaxID=2487770 RepID=A0A3G5A9V9_9VIRU|nr:MAG: hypothetical protein Hyperionvirus16_31 [Hyperionvirus sp.]